MMKLFSRVLPASALLWPAAAFAQAGTPGGGAPPVNVPQNVSALVQRINTIANVAFGFLLVAAFVMFLIAAFYYLFGGATEESKTKAKAMLISGVIAIALGFLAFGLAQIVQQILQAQA